MPDFRRCGEALRKRLASWPIPETLILVTNAKATTYRICLTVRDQEVDGSNPFAPTNLFESATYRMRKSIERLVQGPEVGGSNPFAPIFISPLDPIL